MSLNIANVDAYLRGPFQRIAGWCIPHLWQAIQPLDELQSRRGISNPIAEIGVFHGKFFIGLMKTKQASQHYAIDVFSKQEFNLDGAGKGNLEKFKEGVQDCGEDFETVRVLERDTMSISVDEVVDIRKATGGFSMFSVDGCHMVEHTINDAKLAMELTVPEGVIFIDDYYNAQWPGVQEGICKLYHCSSPRFAPLAATCNKLILCHIGVHSEYLRFLDEFTRDVFPNTRIKKVQRFGYETLTINPDVQSSDYLRLEQ